MDRCRSDDIRISQDEIQSGAWRGQGCAFSMTAARRRITSSALGGATIWIARGVLLGCIPTGTDAAGYPAKFHGAAKGANAALDNRLASHDRSRHGPAAGGRRASAGVSST